MPSASAETTSCRAGAAPHPAHRFIGLHVEREHFFGLIAGLLHGVAVIDEDPLARERIERAPCALSEAFAYLDERKRLSRRVEQAQHLAFLALARVQRRRVCIRGKRVVHLVPAGTTVRPGCMARTQSK